MAFLRRVEGEKEAEEVEGEEEVEGRV